MANEKNRQIKAMFNTKYRGKVKAIIDDRAIPIYGAVELTRDNGFHISSNDLKWKVENDRQSCIRILFDSRYETLSRYNKRTGNDIKYNEDMEIHTGDLLTWAQWRDFNMGFNPKQLTARDFLANIYRGFAFTPVFEGRRKKVNFVKAWHIALDFDTKDEHSSLETLSKHDMADFFASFAYTTPSHTEAAPKARLVFIFDKPITDLKKYEKLYRALMWNFPHADKSAKDALRAFFGSEKCQHWLNWSILPMSSIDDIISQYDDHLEAMKPKHVKQVTAPSANGNKRASKAIQTMLDKIASAKDGNRNQTVLKNSYAIGGYVGGGYIGQAEAETAVYSAIAKMDTDNPEAHENTARQAIANGTTKPITMDIIQTRMNPQSL